VRGDGIIKIEMPLSAGPLRHLRGMQRGHRYNRETLEIRYKGKNIAEILEMSVSEARAFFKNVPVVAGQA